MKNCWECGKGNANKYININRVPEKYKGLYKKGEAQYYMEDIHKREYCDECFEKITKQREKDKSEYIRLKSKLMYERAITMFEEQDVEDFYDYRDAALTIKEYAEENPEKFDSSHEMLAAMILIYNEVKTKIQYKIGKYRADFYLPELKIVLEIDGELHNNTVYRDNKRDIYVREQLGNDWETIRIGTQYIEQNAELLVEAIKTIKKEKQKVRKANYGMLPEWYTARDKAKRPKKTVIGDEKLF